MANKGKNKNIENTSKDESEGNTNEVPRSMQNQVELLAQCVQQNSQLLQLLLNRQNQKITVQTPAVHVRPDASNSVGIFKGTRDDCLASDWLQHFSQVSTLCGWSEQDKLALVNTKLSGGALDWQKSTGSRFSTWDEWENGFREAYVTTISRPEMWRKMESCIQRKDEAIADYVRHKERMCAHISLTFDETKKEILSGLRDRQLCYAMRTGSHRTVNELLRDIADYEEFSKVRQKNFGSGQPHRDNPNKRDDKLSESSRLLEPSSLNNPEPSRNDRTNRKCFNCGDRGHIGRECTKPRRNKYCTNCKKEGHGTKECPINSDRIVNAVGSQSVMPTTSKAFKLIRVDKIPDIPSVLDTGADVSLMKVCLAAKLAKQVEDEPPCELVGVGGKALVCGIVRCSVIIDNIALPDVPFQVVADDTFRGPEVLIGRDVIDLPDMVLIRMRNQSRLVQESDYEFFSSFNIGNQQKVALRSMQKVTVEPRAIQFVTAVTSHTNEEGMVTNDEHPHQLMYVVRENTTSIPLANAGTLPLQIKKNQVILRGNWYKHEPVTQSYVDASGECYDIVVASSENLETNTESTILESQVLDVTRVQRHPIRQDQMKVGPSITLDQRMELCNLLNEFRSSIAIKPDELGCINTAIMKIVEAPGSSPVTQGPYRASHYERQILRDIIEELKAQEVIRDSSSEYSSPVLLVKKKTGEYRMVIDYRKLNAQTIRDKFPLPCIDDLLDRLAGYNLFSILDACQGFNQIPMDEGSSRKAAFTTPDGHYEPTRLIFGLANGPPVFQRAMTVALGELMGQTVSCFVDDIFMGAKDFSDMLYRLRRVLEKLSQAGVTLKLSKCEFAMEEIEYLGFVVSKDGIRPGPRKLAAVAEFPIPKSKDELRRFLGLTSFFRRFIQGYATIAVPLTKLLKHNEPFDWLQDQNTAFQTLRDRLVTRPILKLFDPRDETELHTDASSVGIAGMLLQRGNGNKYQLVYCVSRRTTPDEANYHSSRLELIAAVWSMHRLRPLLIGMHFTLVTDCSALTYLKQQRDIKPQIARWAEQLGEFDFSVRHRAGERMAHVDALSRAPVEERETTYDEVEMTSPAELTTMNVLYIVNEEDRIALIQAQDADIKRLLQIAQKSPSCQTKAEKQSVECFDVIGGILYRMHQREKIYRLFVMPRSMRKYLAIKYHDFSGHFGTDKVVQLIREKYWFPKMTSYIKQHIRQCVSCAFVKVPAGMSQGKLNPVPPGKRPFEIIHMDFLGPFVISSKRNTELLVFVDNLTKFVRLRACSSCSTSQVLRHLEGFVDDFGLPRRIVTDRGTCFTSAGFKNFCEHHHVKHTQTSSQRPQANGQVERINRVLIPMISAHVEKANHRDWDKTLVEVQRCVNWCPSKSTGYSPFKMLYGFTPEKYGHFPPDLVHLDEYEDPEKLRHKATENILSSQDANKRYYDKRHGMAFKYFPGDVIVVRRLPEHTGETTKTQAKYRGPMVVMEILPSDTYRISDFRVEGQGRRRRAGYTTTAHASQLKLFKLVEDGELSDNASDGEDDVQLMPCDTSESQYISPESVVETSVNPEMELLNVPTLSGETPPKRTKVPPAYLKDYEL